MVYSEKEELTGVQGASALLECYPNFLGHAFYCDAVMEPAVQDRLLCGGVDAFDCVAVMEPRLQDCCLCGGGVASVLYVRHFLDEIEPRHARQQRRRILRAAENQT